MTKITAACNVSDVDKTNKEKCSTAYICNFALPKNKIFLKIFFFKLIAL